MDGERGQAGPRRCGHAILSLVTASPRPQQRWELAWVLYVHSLTRPMPHSCALPAWMDAASVSTHTRTRLNACVQHQRLQMLRGNAYNQMCAFLRSATIPVPIMPHASSLALDQLSRVTAVVPHEALHWFHHVGPVLAMPDGSRLGSGSMGKHHRARAPAPHANAMRVSQPGSG